MDLTLLLRPQPSYGSEGVEDPYLRFFTSDSVSPPSSCTKCGSDGGSGVRGKDGWGVRRLGCWGVRGVPVCGSSSVCGVYVW